MKKAIKRVSMFGFMSVCIPDTENPKVIYKLINDFFGKSIYNDDQEFTSDTK